MTKNKVVITDEVREMINEVARATVAASYIDNASDNINYFKAMESLLWNYKKLKMLVEDEAAYCEVEYHSGKKTFAATPHGSGYYELHTESDIIDEMQRQKAISYQRTKARFEEVDRVVRLFANKKEFSVIRMYYFHEDAAGNDRVPEDKQMTFEQIAEELDGIGLARDEKTARRWRNKIVNDMAVCLFGKSAAVGTGMYRREHAK